MKIDHKKLQQFAYNILWIEGVDKEEAELISQVLVWCDLIGRHTHGVVRIPVYLKRFRLGLIKSPCHPKFIQKSKTVYLVEGNDGFGHYLGSLAMSKAIEIAEQCGIGMVGVRRSNHFGANAYYVQMAAEHSKIGLAFTNGFPRTAPHGGITEALGTNPLGFGAPMRNKNSVLVDFSTSAVSGAMIRQAIVENQEIDKGVLIGEDGNFIVASQEAKTHDEGVILPFGGAKGFCLGLMVEILSGVITDSGISHEVGSVYKNFEQASNVGHLFMAIDVSKIIDMELYYDKMNKLVSYIKQAKKQVGIEEILIPGETRWSNYNRQLNEGIDLDSTTIRSLEKIADDLDVSIPW
jgi:LDH2 family malate/lactate/ureidoglycolate dehydrogenase